MGEIEEDEEEVVVEEVIVEEDEHTEDEDDEESARRAAVQEMQDIRRATEASLRERVVASSDPKLKLVEQGKIFGHDYIILEEDNPTQDGQPYVQKLHIRFPAPPPGPPPLFALAAAKKRAQSGATESAAKQSAVASSSSTQAAAPARQSTPAPWQSLS